MLQIFKILTGNLFRDLFYVANRSNSHPQYFNYVKCKNKLSTWQDINLHWDLLGVFILIIDNIAIRTYFVSHFNNHFCPSKSIKIYFWELH